MQGLQELLSAIKPKWFRIGLDMIEVKTDEGINEEFVIELTERIKTLFRNTSYGHLNPKFKKIEEIYSRLMKHVSQETVDELEKEIVRLEK